MSALPCLALRQEMMRNQSPPIFSVSGVQNKRSSTIGICRQAFPSYFIFANGYSPIRSRQVGRQGGLGFRAEVLIEDTHTSIDLFRQGWKSVYVNFPKVK